MKLNKNTYWTCETCYSHRTAKHWAHGFAMCSVCHHVRLPLIKRQWFNTLAVLNFVDYKGSRVPRFRLKRSQISPQLRSQE